MSFTKKSKEQKRPTKKFMEALNMVKVIERAIHYKIVEKFDVTRSCLDPELIEMYNNFKHIVENM